MCTVQLLCNLHLHLSVVCLLCLRSIPVVPVGYILFISLMPPSFNQSSSQVPWAVTANVAFKNSGAVFDCRFPKTGGGEDIDFCLRASPGGLVAVPEVSGRGGGEDIDFCLRALPGGLVAVPEVSGRSRREDFDLSCHRASPGGLVVPSSRGEWARPEGEDIDFCLRASPGGLVAVPEVSGRGRREDIDFCLRALPCGLVADAQSHQPGSHACKAPMYYRVNRDRS